MRDYGILTQKGKGRATYYVFAETAIGNTEGEALNTEGKALNTEGVALNTEGKRGDKALNTEGGVDKEKELNTSQLKKEKLLAELKDDTKKLVEQLGEREKDKEKIKKVILSICQNRDYKLSELSLILERKENYLSRTFIKPLVDSQKLQYKIPDMINHPDQSYLTTKN